MPTPTAFESVSEPLPLRARWRSFWEPPEQFLLDAGHAGELLIARIRLGLTGFLLLIPIANLLFAPAEERQQHVTGFAINIVALALSVAIYFLIKRDRRQPWLPLATSCFDVTVISAANLAFAFIGDPNQVVNSKITFDTYFIALGGTCLRYDKRVALIAGGVAMAQFLAIVAFVAVSFPLDTVGHVSVYGRFQWSDQISRLILLATATALCIYIVGGIQKQRELSNADPLTGVFNRRFFDDYIVTEIARAKRYATTVAIAMIDVDHFKQFNDRFGHAAGDAALRRVAQAIRLGMRRSDVVARYGGEEFIVLLREVDASQAIDRVEEIRQAILAESHVIGDSRPVHVTVSAGVAVLPVDGITVGELLSTADRRLFEAKDSGRNRIVGPTWPPELVRAESCA